VLCPCVDDPLETFRDISEVASRKRSTDMGKLRPVWLCETRKDG
jgi:hypothetical protein